MTDDEQEATSIKYNVARIVKLSTGRFALFHPFDNDRGMPLRTIGTIEELAPLIPSSEEITLYLDKLPKFIPYVRPKPSERTATTLEDLA